MNRQFPIGPFVAPDTIEEATRTEWIDRIEALPARFRRAVEGLAPKALDTPYREGGWTRRQVAHHVADSHLNSLIRFKWTLTESNPTIKAYDERSWAELADYEVNPVSVSLDFLDALHARWVPLLRSLTEDQWRRTFVHPESGDTVDLATNVGIYAWHGDHHLAHIELPL